MIVAITGKPIAVSVTISAASISDALTKKLILLPAVTVNVEPQAGEGETNAGALLLLQLIIPLKTAKPYTLLPMPVVGGVLKEVTTVPVAMSIFCKHYL